MMKMMVIDGIANRMLQVHPSNPVCFFCEVMLRLFDVKYDKEFASKKLYPKWEDPTGYFIDEKENYYTPRDMLKLFGMNVKEAVNRVLPLFSDIKNPGAFVDCILDGGLQGKREMRKMISDLKKGSEILAKLISGKGQ